MRIFFVALLFCSFPGFSQSSFQRYFDECQVKGSITLYDYTNKKWIFSDSTDALTVNQPASTYKVINLLIALETEVIRDENEIVKWPGSTDTSLYGYRPEIYKDMSVKEAFEVSAGWVFIELAKRVGRKRYAKILRSCGYGNGDLSERGTDFWNFGAFKISPRNQVEFLVKMYEGKVPFSPRNLNLLKRVMITEKNEEYTLRSKTGWTRTEGMDIGWWVGYMEKEEGPVFFCTRIIKERTLANPEFGNCRKTITKAVLKDLGWIMR